MKVGALRSIVWDDQPLRAGAPTCWAARVERWTGLYWEHVWASMLNATRAEAEDKAAQELQRQLAKRDSEQITGPV